MSDEYDQSETLFTHAENDDTESVKSIMDKLIKITARKKYNPFRYIFCYCTSDKIPVIQMADDDGNTLMHYAAKNGNINLAKYFIENDGDPCLYNVDGLLPMHDAIICDHIEFVQYLIESQVDINIRTQSRKTSLDLAIRNNNLDIVKLLVGTIITDGGLKIIKGNHDSVTRVGIKYTSKRFNIHYKSYPLNCGIEPTGWYSSADNYDKIDYGISNSFYIAVVKNRYEIMEYLLEINCNSAKDIFEKMHQSIKSSDMNKAIKHCIRRNKLNMLILLSKYIGENPRKILFDKRDTILHLLFRYVDAIDENLITLVENFEVLLNHQNNSGDIPLHIVAEKGNSKLYQLLVDHGSDENIKNFILMTPSKLLSEIKS